MKLNEAGAQSTKKEVPAPSNPAQQQSKTELSGSQKSETPSTTSVSKNALPNLPLVNLAVRTRNADTNAVASSNSDNFGATSEEQTKFAYLSTSYDPEATSQAQPNQVVLQINKWATGIATPQFTNGKYVISFDNPTFAKNIASVVAENNGFVTSKGTTNLTKENDTTWTMPINANTLRSGQAGSQTNTTLTVNLTNSLESLKLANAKIPFTYAALVNDNTISQNSFGNGTIQPAPKNTVDTNLLTKQKYASQTVVYNPKNNQIVSTVIYTPTNTAAASGGFPAVLPNDGKLYGVSAQIPKELIPYIDLNNITIAPYSVLDSSITGPTYNLQANKNGLVTTATNPQLQNQDGNPTVGGQYGQALLKMNALIQPTNAGQPQGYKIIYKLKPKADKAAFENAVGTAQNKGIVSFQSWLTRSDSYAVGSPSQMVERSYSNAYLQFPVNYVPIKDPEKTKVADKTKLTEPEKEAVKTAINTANPNLPTGTTITVDDKGNATVTEPGFPAIKLDPSKTVEQVPDADKYSPEGQKVTTPKGTEPDAKSGIKTPDDLPAGTTYAWKDKPNVSKAGDVPATVVVTYPDGTKDEVPVTITVTDNTPNTGEGSQPSTDMGTPTDNLPTNLPDQDKGNDMPDMDRGSEDTLTPNKGGDVDKQKLNTVVQTKSNQAMSSTPTAMANFHAAKKSHLANQAMHRVAKLPQTGEQSNNVGIFGLIIAGVAGLFGLADLRKKRK